MVRAVLQTLISQGHLQYRKSATKLWPSQSSGDWQHCRRWALRLNKEGKVCRDQAQRSETTHSSETTALLAKLATATKKYLRDDTALRRLPLLRRRSGARS